MLLKKRSFSLSRHRTSVALEDEFWSILEAEARRAGISLAAFVSGVDKARGPRPLASALRLAALAAAKSAP
jgi:predicted DNA-binding ribbon-helix-helix protein